MIDYALIPEGIMAGLRRYVDEGISPGHFLTAVLENNLVEALGRADEDSQLALHSIVAWVWNEAPAACWGDAQRMQRWQAMHAKRRQATEVNP